MKLCLSLCLLLVLGSTCYGEDLKIVAFGDSTTAPRSGVTELYADILRNELPDHGIQATVLNKGVGGNTTADAVARFATDVLAHDPDLVVMQFGINDSTVDVWKTPSATEPRVSLADYTTNLTGMVQTMKAADIRVIMMTHNALGWSDKTIGYYGPAPYNDYNPNAVSPYDVNDPWGFNNGREVYVDAVRAIAQQESVELLDVYQMYVDHRADGNDHGDLLLDGMHPNDTGHRMVGDALLTMIVPEPASIALLATILVPVVLCRRRSYDRAG